MKEKLLLPLSILVLAGALAVAAAIWGVVTDREGRRRDNPPWAASERRHAQPSGPAKPLNCAEVTKKRYDPDFGPGGVFEYPGYVENWDKPTDLDRQAARILGCEFPEAP